MLTEAPARTRRTQFRTWRAGRPFWGGTLLLLSAAFLLLPPFVSFEVGDLLISISTIAGVSTILLGSLMVLCGVSTLANPAVRFPAGITALVLALVALPAANFGGFIVGSILGILGAAAILSWRWDS